jgi:hypothetical protein
VAEVSLRSRGVLVAALAAVVVVAAALAPRADALPSVVPPGSPTLFQAPAPTTAGCVVDLDDMIGWWKGEDDLLGLVGPTLTGSVGFTDGEVGRAMDFDPSRVAATDALPTVSSAVSVEAWVKPVATGQTQALVSRWTWVGGEGDDSYALFLGPNSDLFWTTDDVSTRSPESISVRVPEIYDGGFHHVAATWSATEMAVYLDGQLVASQRSQGGVLNPGTTTPFRLGGSSGPGSAFPYTGVLDEPTVYDRALTGAEIAAIHENGPEGKCPPGDPSGTQVALVADDGADGDLFGYSVAVNGTTMVIGAPVADVAVGPASVVAAGAAYVFTRTGTTWTQQAKLVAADARAGANLGWSVALAGDTIVLGAPNDRPPNGAFRGGSAYVFTRTGTTWAQQAKLTAPDAAIDDNFGHAVSVAADTALVGSYRDDTTAVDTGSAYVFTRSGTLWNQEAKLVPADAAASDTAGFSVALAGDLALVGAVQADAPGADSGAAYAWARTGTTWVEEAKLVATDGVAGDAFGFSVGLNGTSAIVGAPNVDGTGANSGAAYVFTRSGTSWSQQTKLTAGDGTGGAVFGRSVAVNLNRAVVGAPLDDEMGVDAGAAYLFTRSGTTWSQLAKLTAATPSAAAVFGFDVTLNSVTAAATAPNDDQLSPDAGATYVFTLF